MDQKNVQQHPVVEKRSKEEMLKAPRSSSRSLLMYHRERNPENFLSKALWAWIKDYVSTAFLPRHRYLTYGPSDSAPGIYTMPNRCKVALASDWGSGTVNAYRVRDRILAQEPQITIHLGDVYYSGKFDEFADYFLGDDDWPRGNLPQDGTFTSLPAYALNANHEMYSGGFGYFDAITNHLGQKTSYFCVENDHWRVLAIDSGYYSKILPLLELLPFWIRVHRETRNWLVQHILSANDSRPIIVLSHHEWFSAFDTEYKRLGQGLGTDPRYLLWFWGHEHRFAGYGAYQAREDGPIVRARCIGHGGMPIENIDQHPKRERNLVCYDERQADVVDGIPVGYCGFAMLNFQDEALTITYEDEQGLVLLEESWVIGPEGPMGSIVAVQDNQLTLTQPAEALVS